MKDKYDLRGTNEEQMVKELRSILTQIINSNFIRGPPILKFYGKELQKIDSATIFGQHYFEVVDKEESSIEGVINKLTDYQVYINIYDKKAQGCCSAKDIDLACYFIIDNSNIRKYKIKILRAF